MAYSYYAQRPAWGTNQFQFEAPPAPAFQPQPSWRGLDYYRAHAISPDPSLYNNAWSAVRHPGDYPGIGMHENRNVGMHESRYWHNRVYSGYSDINSMLPEEIGHAAAYEAHRHFLHFSGTLYGPLGGDLEAQREAFVGWTIGEVSRLYEYSSRRPDGYTLRRATEAAAATASRIFYESRNGYDDDYDRGRSTCRRSAYGDAYNIDSAYYPRPRSHSRRRSSSAYRHPLLQDSYHTDYPPTSSMPIPTMGSSVIRSGYPDSYGSYGSYASSVSSAYSGGGSVMMPGTSPSYNPGDAASYSNALVPMRSRHTSISYPYAPTQPQTQYVHSAMPAPPHEIVIYKPKSHRRRHHKHRSRARSVSPNRYVVRI
ncbi:hypothetical protein D9758_002083 [Tetrapyrgos nigripes]|uniref:Uncharacterized protein n=1 Tax=Tetrapyrgos nigripes TaxID=182062 RepID=A0A8H5LV89_9AGAR|nr:hypothetical protein D9758_002083 [Tetrapyrgos nigripes]